MKKQILAIVCCGAVLLAGCQPEESPPQTARPPAPSTARGTNLAPGQAVLRFEISGMHCDGCAGGLTSELQHTPGVTTATVTFSNQLAVVTCDTNRLSPDGLVKVVQEAGFGARRLHP